MQPSPDGSYTPVVVGRRSARLSIIVPVTMRGTDAAGQTFKENTWTISANKHGGRIATFRQLAVDDEIVIENPLLGRSAKARVNRVCEKHFAEDPYEVCVELLEAQNVWGVKLPPEDLQKEEEIVAEDQKSSTPQAAPQAQTTSAATAEKDGKVETAQSTPQGSPAEVGENNGGLSLYNMAVKALSRFAGEANAPPAQPASLRQDALGVPNSPAEHLQAPALLEFKFLQEKIGEAQSLRQELSILADRVHSARAEVENLLLKASERRRDWTLEAVQVLPLAQENLSKVTLEFQAQCKGATEQARARLDEFLNDAASVVDVRIREIMEAVLPSLSAQIERSAEQAAREQLEEFKAQIERARSSSEDSIQHNLERVRQEISEKANREVSEKLEGAVERALDAVARDSNKQAEDALELLKERLLSAQVQCVEETRRQLAAARESTLTSLQSEAGENLASFRERLHTTLREILAQQTKEMETEIQTSLQGPLESLRPSRDPLPPVPASLVEKQQQIIKEALGAIRSRLNQIFVNQTPKE
jgi:hypothetical protein